MSQPNKSAKLMIKLLHQQDQVFEITQDSIKIGRGEEADLILPNVSISRVHAILQKTPKGFVIKDNKSQNGFRINKENAKEHHLRTGDEIQIGIFTLIFLGNRLEDNYYRGRSVVYLPPYDPQVFATNDDATFKMSLRDKNMLSRKTGLLHNACIIGEHGQYFYPESNDLSFGKKSAIVKVTGLLVFGTVATISWNGKEHLLKSESWLATVRVNGKRITDNFLRVGDNITIGSSKFSYTLREGS